MTVHTYAVYVLQTFHRLCKTSVSVRALETRRGREEGGGREGGGGRDGTCELTCQFGYCLGGGWGE